VAAQVLTEHHANLGAQISAAVRVRRAFEDGIVSDAELGDLRLISRNGWAE
jgi:hypothetical protein